MHHRRHNIFAKSRAVFGGGSFRCRPVSDCRRKFWAGRNDAAIKHFSPKKLQAFPAFHSCTDSLSSTTIRRYSSVQGQEEEPAASVDAAADPEFHERLRQHKLKVC